MNSGSGMMRIGVTGPLVSLIAIFFVLNLFFGVWVLALPLAAALALLVFFIGAKRLVRPVGDLAEARRGAVNLFGLPDLPRFYGFLHIFCWFIPPILFLIGWQFAGTAWLDAQFTQMSYDIIGDVQINYAGMAEASRSLFLNYFFNSPLPTALAPYATDFSAAFDAKNLARRWLWVAIAMVSVAVWRAVPKMQNASLSTAFLPGTALALASATLLQTGFIWLGAAVALIAIACLALGKFGRIGLDSLLGKICLLFGVVAVVVWVNHWTQWGAGGWIYSTALFIAALVTLWTMGERFAWRNSATLILCASLGAFAVVVLVSALDMTTWVQTFVATDFGRPAQGALDTEGARVMRFVAEIRNGTEITPELIKKARATPDYVEAARDWIATNKAAQTFVFAGVLVSLVLGAVLSVLLIRPTTRARRAHETSATVLLVAASAIAIFVTIGLVLALLGQAELFFAKVPAQEFLNELKWNKGGVHYVESDGERKSTLGGLPVFYGTFMVSLVALFFAVPVGLFAAICMSEYANQTVRNIFKPILEILAGVPTIVYGVFALLIVGPWVRGLWGDFGEPITGYEMSGRSALVAGGVMGIMLIPFISSLSDDALKSVPRPLRDGSLALGANKSETILKVLLPAALPGIMGGILLATSRAIGETMIVVLAAGRFAQIEINPLEPMTTVTVQIVEFLTGDIALDTPEALSAFGLGLVLFLATLVLNMVAIVIVRRYRQKYS